MRFFKSSLFVKNKSVVIVLSCLFLAALGCGVKGKPLPPLKKGEVANPTVTRESSHTPKQGS